MAPNVYVYIGLMALTTYLVRVLPILLIRKPIRNRFVQSFLYYVPYVTLAVMTFPAILKATQTPALAAGVLCAWLRAGLFQVAAVCCAVVFVTELILC